MPAPSRSASWPSRMFFAFGCRSRRYTLLELGLFTNPYLFGAVAVSGLLQLGVVTLPFARPVFDIATNPLREWVLILFLASDSRHARRTVKVDRCCSPQAPGSPTRSVNPTGLATFALSRGREGAKTRLFNQGKRRLPAP